MLPIDVATILAVAVSKAPLDQDKWNKLRDCCEEHGIGLRLKSIDRDSEEWKFGASSRHRRCDSVTLISPDLGYNVSIDFVFNTSTGQILGSWGPHKLWRDDVKRKPEDW